MISSSCSCCFKWLICAAAFSSFSQSGFNSWRSSVRQSLCSSAARLASVSCLLRHAEGSRADCAIEQRELALLAFALRRLASGTCPSFVCNSRMCRKPTSRSLAAERHELRRAGFVGTTVFRIAGETPPPAFRRLRERLVPAARGSQRPPLPPGAGRANSWGLLPTSTAEMGGSPPSHCTR